MVFYKSLKRHYSIRFNNKKKKKKLFLHEDHMIIGSRVYMYIDILEWGSRATQFILFLTDSHISFTIENPKELSDDLYAHCSDCVIYQ